MSAVLAEADGVAPAEESHARMGHGALDALCLIARLHHVAAEPAALRHQLGNSASEESPPTTCCSLRATWV